MVFKFFSNLIPNYSLPIYRTIIGFYILGLGPTIFLKKFFKLKKIFFYLVWPHGLSDFSSPTRDQTRAPAVKVPSPNHWAAWEFPGPEILMKPFTSLRAFCRFPGFLYLDNHVFCKLEQLYVFLSKLYAFEYFFLPYWTG